MLRVARGERTVCFWIKFFLRVKDSASVFRTQIPEPASFLRCLPGGVLAAPHSAQAIIISLLQKPYVQTDVPLVSPFKHHSPPPPLHTARRSRGHSQPARGRAGEGKWVYRTPLEAEAAERAAAAAAAACSRGYPVMPGSSSGGSGQMLGLREKRESKGWRG